MGCSLSRAREQVSEPEARASKRRRQDTGSSTDHAAVVVAGESEQPLDQATSACATRSVVAPPAGSPCHPAAESQPGQAARAVATQGQYLDEILQLTPPVVPPPAITEPLTELQDKENVLPFAAEESDIKSQKCEDINDSIVVDREIEQDVRISQDHAEALEQATQEASTLPPITAAPPRRKVRGSQRHDSAQMRASTSAPPPKARATNKKAAAAEPAASPVSASPASGSSSLPAPAVADHGEAWQAYLDRTAQRVSESKSSPSSLFEAFRTAHDLDLVFASFVHLHHLAVAEQGHGKAFQEVPPWSCPTMGVDVPWQFPYEAIRVLVGGNWKAKQLWEKLDVRIGKSDYNDSPCGPASQLAGRRCVVVGAGPCGLRAAIELRLLGAHVTVVERRESFTRINQLHLWPWCGEELKALGARNLEPPGQDFGSNPDLLHIGIAELQCLLLKTALLLGTEVFVGTDFLGAEFDSASQSWSVRLQRNARMSSSAEAHTPDEGGLSSDAASTKLPASPLAPGCLSDVAVLIGADGLSCRVGQSLGIDVSEVGTLRSEDAIGLVCNFKHVASGKERALRCFALARQFYGQLFQKLTEDTGLDLENIVYTKSRSSHYFVMTPTRRSLVRCGVLRDGSHRPLLAEKNVDRTALDAVIRKVIAFRFKEKEPTLAEVSDEPMAYADAGPQLFDFSKLRRAASNLKFVEPPADKALHGSAPPLLFSLVGDALLEPFWPEGLGIIRGFFSALDVCWAISQWASGASPESILLNVASTFAELKTLGARTRGNVLRKEEAHFALAPSTRYKNLSGLT